MNSAKWSMSSSVTVRARSLDRVADRQLGEALAERVASGPTVALRAGRPATGDRGHHVGGGLDRGALHVVEHGADAAELLAAAGPAGTAVHQHRERRAVAGRLLRVVAVEDQDPAVPGRDAERHRAGHVGVVGDQRADQGAPAAGRELDRLVDRVVGRARCRPDRTARRRGARSRPGSRAAAPGTGRRRARGRRRPRRRGPGRRTRSRRRRAAPGPPCGPPRAGSRLASAPIRTSSWAGLPTVTLASRADDRLDDGVRPSRSGTIARRIAVHFWPALTVISATTPLTNRSNSGSSVVTSGTEDRAVQRVGLDAEADAAVEHVGVGAQQPGGVRGAGERDRVLHGQLVEQAAGAAAQQLQRALGQDAGLDDAAYDELGEVRRLAGRLDDRRQPGEERGGELLEHAPDREVEGVDLHRDARPRGVDVLADERAARGRAARGRRRARRCRWAARGCPCWRRRRPCRCRRRCRPCESRWVAPVRGRQRVELVLVPGRGAWPAP